MFFAEATGQDKCLVTRNGWSEEPWKLTTEDQECGVNLQQQHFISPPNMVVIGHYMALLQIQKHDSPYPGLYFGSRILYTNDTNNKHWRCWGPVTPHQWVWMKNTTEPRTLTLPLTQLEKYLVQDPDLRGTYLKTSPQSIYFLASSS